MTYLKKPERFLSKNHSLYEALAISNYWIYHWFQAIELNLSINNLRLLVLLDWKRTVRVVLIYRKHGFAYRLEKSAPFTSSQEQMRLVEVLKQQRNLFRWVLLLFLWKRFTASALQFPGPSGGCVKYDRRAVHVYSTESIDYVSIVTSF